MNAARARKRTKDQVVDLVSKAEVNSKRIAALERENNAMLDQVQLLSVENQRLRDIIRHQLNSATASARPTTSLDAASTTALAQNEHLLRGLGGGGTGSASAYGMLTRGPWGLGGGHDPLLGIQQSEATRRLLTSSSAAAAAAGEAIRGQQQQQLLMGQRRAGDDHQLLIAALLQQQQQQSNGLHTATSSLGSALLGATRSPTASLLQSPQLMGDMQQQQQAAWLQALLEANNNNEKPQNYPISESGRDSSSS